MMSAECASVVIHMINDVLALTTAAASVTTQGNSSARGYYSARYSSSSVGNATPVGYYDNTAALGSARKPESPNTIDSSSYPNRTSSILSNTPQQPLPVQVKFTEEQQLHLELLKSLEEFELSIMDQFLVFDNRASVKYTAATATRLSDRNSTSNQATLLKLPMATESANRIQLNRMRSSVF